MELIVGGCVSMLASLLLWFFLPRGVVLTSPGDDSAFQIVRNESPLPVRILKVTLSGAAYIDDRGRFIEVDVTDSYDEHLQVLGEGDAVWRGHVIAPGHGVGVRVHGNSCVTIRYRRAGWSGVAERRRVDVFGGV